MTDQYEKSKADCWENFWEERSILPISHPPLSEKELFLYAFDRAYALGKQEKDAATVIQGWLARDENNSLYLYEKRPVRDHNEWIEETVIYLDDDLFSDLTWDDNPIEVEIIIKRKKK